MNEIIALQILAFSVHALCPCILPLLYVDFCYRTGAQHKSLERAPVCWGCIGHRNNLPMKCVATKFAVLCGAGQCMSNFRQGPEVVPGLGQGAEPCHWLGGLLFVRFGAIAASQHDASQQAFLSSCVERGADCSGMSTRQLEQREFDLVCIRNGSSHRIESS